MKSFMLGRPRFTNIENEMQETLRLDSANFRQQLFSLPLWRSTRITATRFQLGVPP
jgi:hypothetical protein